MKPKNQKGFGSLARPGAREEGRAGGGSWVSPAERGLIGMCVSFSFFGWGEADAPKCWQR